MRLNAIFGGKISTTQCTDGEATTAHRQMDGAMIDAGATISQSTPRMSTIGRTVVRPYIAPRLILTQSFVVARSSLRAITFAPKLRCAPFFRSHPSPLFR
jgi:hypothetical protein